MSYIALARKWRPQNFSQLVGQDHVNRTLINSLDQQRLHHAYIFTGTRGVGKTSVARLLAKSLNCQQGITSKPCLQCDACIAIEQGRFVDLIEIDAASKTRVEDTRELLENVQYATTSGRFKIYLIDEVHMLSQHSFNALLKTLEEPPSHVKFLLATTDPQKLPITVLSRCLQFNLKHLTPDIIAAQLQHIMNEEHRPCAHDALQIISKAARGSMRDALSILDQVLVSTDGDIDAQTVKSVLGYTQQDFAIQLLQALIKQDPAEIVTLSRQIAADGGHFAYVLEEIIHYLHEITLHQALHATHPLLIPSDDILSIAKQISENDTQLFYQIALKGMQDMSLAPTLALGFEMTLLRMLCFRPLAPVTLAPSHFIPTAESIMPSPASNVSLPTAASVAAKPTTNAPAAKTNSAPSQPSASSTEQTISITEIKPQTTTNQTPKPTSEPLSIQIPTPSQEPLEENVDCSWETLLPQLGLTGLARTAANNAALISQNDYELVLGIQSGHESLFTPSTTMRIEEALSNYYHKKIKLVLRTDQEETNHSPAKKKLIKQDNNQKHAEKSIQEDPFLKQLQETFSAEIVKNSITFHEDEL